MGRMDFFFFFLISTEALQPFSFGSRMDGTQIMNPRFWTNGLVGWACFDFWNQDSLKHEVGQTNLQLTSYVYIYIYIRCCVKPLPKERLGKEDNP